MSTQAAEPSVRASIVVEAPIERAFSVFTEDFDRIKATRAQPARRGYRGDDLRAAPGRRIL